MYCKEGAEMFKENYFIGQLKIMYTEIYTTHRPYRQLDKNHEHKNRKMPAFPDILVTVAIVCSKLIVN